MPIQTATGSTAFASVLDAIVSRIGASAALASVPVRVVADPEGRISEYQGQDAVLVHVSKPYPRPSPGAARYCRLAYRVVSLIVLTMNLLDEAGSDNAAVHAHLNREEAIVDAVDLIGPVGAPTNIRTAILIEWTDGGADLERQLRTDPGQFVSVLQFRVLYQAPTSANL